MPELFPTDLPRGLPFAIRRSIWLTCLREQNNRDEGQRNGPLVGVIVNYLACPARCRTGNPPPTEERCTAVATDYDELRIEVKESPENSLEALRQSAG